MTEQAISPLRRRMIEDMTIRKFAQKTRRPNITSRGRDEDYSPPPAQIPACAANAPGLYEEAAVKGICRWCLAIYSTFLLQNSCVAFL
jgi:hypothetical protein